MRQECEEQKVRQEKMQAADAKGLEKEEASENIVQRGYSSRNLRVKLRKVSTIITAFKSLNATESYSNIIESNMF